MIKHIENLIRRVVLAGTAIVALGAVLIATPAFAQDGPGMRAGLSADPDQFFIGAHYVTQPVTGMLRLQPNVEAGFGNDLTTVAFNADAALWVKISPDWHLYVVGGPSMNVYNYSLRDKKDVQAGLNAIAGIRRRGGLFLELKVGAFNSPSVKLLVGYTIR
jgi:hypothetical protein